MRREAGRPRARDRLRLGCAGRNRGARVRRAGDRERYGKSTDFIQQYFFPGGLLPSPAAFRAAAAEAGLRIVGELDFGLDYAETLRRWRAAFLGADGPVRRLGFDTRFMRIWEFYLAHCEAAFATRNTSVMQFMLQR